MFAWLPLIVGILSGLPQIITGVESVFKSKPKSGPQKWIAVETALSSVIEQLANDIAKMSPNKDAQQISSEVAVFTKAVNDAIVKFFNAVGWPTDVTNPTAPIGDTKQ
jgi:hypothetical protein